MMTSASSNHRRRFGLACVTAFAALTLQAAAQDWPQYFGPRRDGTTEFVVPERATLVEVWRRPFPSGTAGITVAGERVYTSGSDGTDDVLFALDAVTGKDVWRASLGPTHRDAADGPASTPIVVNDLVVAIGSSCRVQAVRAADGTVAWQRSLADDYKSRFAARGGCGVSPLASGSLVIVPTGASEGARLVALDAASGKEAWRSADIPSSLNGAPGVAEFGGLRQILYHHAKPPGLSGLSAVRIDNGTTLWQVDSPDGMSDTMPLALPDGRVLLQTWKNSTLFETSPTPRAVWTSDELSATGPPPVHHDGHLYGFGGNSGEFLKCVDVPTGQAKWSARPYRGSVLLVGRTLVMLSESAGLLRLIAADPAAYREQARLQVLKPGARTMTPPSFAQGRVFVRNLDEIVAVAIR